MNKQYFYLILSIAIIFSGCSTRGKGVYRANNYTPANDYSSSSSYNPSPTQKTYSHPTMRPYVVRGKKYYPTVVSVGDDFKGTASWYGPDFHGKLTSNGEKYNMWDMTAAHKTLPMNTIVKVTNRRNGKSAVVRVNDRGPFVDTRIIDLSKAAASKIDMIGTGTAPVKLEVLGFAGKGTKKTPVTKKELDKELENSPKTVDMDQFLLQIGSFSKIEGALTTQEKYDNTDGYHTMIKDVQTQQGRMFKVVLSGFKSEQEARDYKSLGKFEHAFILRED
ncbi:septal ring lytic transglycosylase RlpA family protein [Sulfurimonas sp.]|uniref:septal ring lytic transglycosylase RlpA family protein n=1 Tax=Sulfurimonas sp. TaxID=2022749 RepID=UPI003D0ED819